MSNIDYRALEIDRARAKIANLMLMLNKVKEENQQLKLTLSGKTFCCPICEAKAKETCETCKEWQVSKHSRAVGRCGEGRLCPLALTPYDFHCGYWGKKGEQTNDK